MLTKQACKGHSALVVLFNRLKGHTTIGIPAALCPWPASFSHLSANAACESQEVSADAWGPDEQEE